MRNECWKSKRVRGDTYKQIKQRTTTKKEKYLVIKESSKPVYLGIPSNLARSLRMIGRRAIRTASRNGGRIP